MRKILTWGVLIFVPFLFFLPCSFAQEAQNDQPMVQDVQETPQEARTDKEVILEKAEKIRYDSAGETFVATGGVVAVQGANRIQCQELTFNLKNNKGSFKGEVIVTRDETEIRSSFMEGDFDAEIYLFKEGVELKKERKEEGGETSFIFWKAPLLYYNGNTEEAWGEEGAEIEWKETKIKADQAHYYPEKEETGEEERIVLEGNVLITEKDREMEVAKAVYYLDTEVLEAEGISHARFLIQEKSEE
ncbi:LptA/OstA family protein [Candidatus Sordicultor fermentans]|uniref:LptA/OstA family protein n=1 Tax=Candidatus Sordicultor fermentans TaxID=1953203 RepID=UPI0039088B02